MSFDGEGSLAEVSSFKLGKLYIERAEFDEALGALETAATESLYANDMDQYLQILSYRLRIYAEMENSSGIQATKEKLQDLCIREKVELNSKVYYTLALCSSFKGQLKPALEHLEKALAVALKADHKEDICYAIHGFATVYYQQGRYEDSLKEIYNLKVFFQIMSMPELSLSSSILNGYILLKLGREKEALELFWQAYEELKVLKNLYMHIVLLIAIGVTYGEMGEENLARLYLGLADRVTDPKSLVRASQSIADSMKKYSKNESIDYDLKFDSHLHIVHEKAKGRIDFKNQFVLLDLLKLFLGHPGEVFSKEELVKKVWRQDYNPAVHDNKIYVTIKRLRKLIEPDYEKPRYIFRAKNGYFLNKSARVAIEG